MPYIVKQMLNMVTRPAAPRVPAAPAMGVFLRGPVVTNGPTSRYLRANPTSIPLKRGLTEVLYAGKFERYQAIRGLEVIGVSKLPMNGSPLIGWITW
ncbi:hypothetical protein Scep_012074 [Stephania cephalantha]|uniref:Uncharacterized protein n=1 Tax=Stephania cephalantha TaxID=152367 RepID=A0AAP0JEA5_9MAGN